jgi:alkylglycerol monooxygenase
MELYGTILNRVIPVFFLLYFIERFVAWRRGAAVIRELDSVSSFSSGMTNIVKDVLGISVGIISYGWLVEHLALIHTPAVWWTYLIGFVAIDFKGYWVHRWSHEINYLWNRHIIHHSSEEFNLSCALRQSISEFVNYFTILLLPAALLGVPVEVVAIIGPAHLFLQYWYHTQLIHKMGWLEYWLVTPSHHRVHHAMNKEYLDKNYGQIFILWDRWFGTFQEERSDVPPVYGVTRPVSTFNPLKINFLHVGLLFQDAWRTRSWRDKLRIWFMPTGWRPDDVKEQYPVPSIKDPYHFTKYDVPASKWFKAWAWTQLLFCYFLLVYYFAFLGKIGTPNIFYYGGFLVFSIFAYTELMDRQRYAIVFEFIRATIGIYFIVSNNWDWFGANNNIGTWYTSFIVIYLTLSVPIVAWFTWGERYEAPRMMTIEG